MTDKASERTLRIVRGLLDQADDAAATPQEAASFREKAEMLIRKYRIEQEDVLARDPQQMAPERVEMDVASMSSEFFAQYFHLLVRIADHVGIRIKNYWHGGDLKVSAIGYDVDLKLAEMMFTSARMVFSEHLEPKPQPHLSEQENVYRMRKAGMERNKIANIMWNAGPKDGAAHGKVARLYKAECAARGEDATVSGRGLNAGQYRTSYADGFVAQFTTRLRKAREGADRIGGALSLAGREERVNEAFYTAFPELRPAPEGTVAQRPAGSPSKKERKLKAWTAADERRYRRQFTGAALAGKAAGRAAADEVALDGSAPARRLDDREDEARVTTRAVQGLLEG